MFSNFIIYLLCFNSLFLLISTEQGAQKNIFDETNLKHLKLKKFFFSEVQLEIVHSKMEK